MSATPAALQLILERISAAPARLGPGPGPTGAMAPGVEAVRLVCVDGPAGSGKTTLAEQLADRLGSTAHVVHLDDLYAGWTGLPKVPHTIDRDVLAPMAAGRSGSYRRYDWHREEFAERVTVPRAPVLILEGCGAGSRVVDPYLGVLVWVRAPDDVRLRRGLERDGEAMEAKWRAFMADERVLYHRERTALRAHVVLNGWGEVVEPDG